MASGCSLARLMAGKLSSRVKAGSAVIALPAALAYPAYSTLACDAGNGGRHVVADAAPAPAEKGKSERDCHNKRADGQRTPANKPCPDGGERLPQDRRSPLDTLPPLAPL